MGVAVERMPSAQLKAGVQRCEEEGDVRKYFETFLDYRRTGSHNR